MIFGHLPDGRAVEAIRLSGPHLSATILTLGATVQDLRMQGVAHPLVLGFPALAPYLGAGLYVGALVGRVANRIGGARFTLDGREVRVDANEGANLLHGGADGIHRQLWRVEERTPDRVRLALDLPDGHMGFPGNLAISAQISVADDALDFDLTATPDAATPVSLAHHGYFTLDDSGDIRAHRLQVAAEHYLPVDAELIPTGQVAPVAGTDHDFRQAREIGAGHDHNLCLSHTRTALRPVATLTGQTGLRMDIETTEPGMQLYDGRHLGHAGVALETQIWPDAVNRPAFPDPILRPGETFRARTRYRFRP